jgi:uncharacterized C2H2 Zn-finger protein
MNICDRCRLQFDNEQSLQIHIEKVHIFDFKYAINMESSVLPKKQLQQ